MQLAAPTIHGLRAFATATALVLTGAVAMAQAQVNTDLPPTAAGTPPSASDMFAKFDKNRDGKLSREESQGLPAIAGRFDALDKDKDGYLSLDEFSVGLKPAQ